MGRRKLFSEGQVYDDDGKLLTAGYSYNFFKENATYSETLQSPYDSGITNMYDGDSTSFYITIGPSTSTAEMKWDFGRKVKFKNIYVVIRSEPGAATDSGSFQGSNDDSSYTSLDTYSNAGADADLTMLASNVAYRYIKVFQTKSAASGNSGIKAILGVVDR